MRAASFLPEGAGFTVSVRFTRSMRAQISLSGTWAGTFYFGGAKQLYLRFSEEFFRREG